MPLSASLIIALLLSASMIACEPVPSARPQPHDDAAPTRKAVRWLLKQQDADGGWHSQTYGKLRGGTAVTAIILHALAHLPDDERQAVQPQIDRAMTRLLRHVDAQGFPCNPDGSSDYPHHAAALFILSHHRMHPAQAAARRPLIDALLRAQQSAQQGWAPADPDFGGWNQTGTETSDAKIIGQTNISVTSLVIDALSRDGMNDDAATRAAIEYLTRCHNGDAGEDGGFHFTPRIEHFLNKAGQVRRNDRITARSYGSATADGVAALLALNLPLDDPRTQTGLAWLKAHPEVIRVPVSAEAQAMTELDDFRSGLRFYYAFSLARLIHHLPTGSLSVHRERLRDSLIKSQRADGSWRSDSTYMLEDDPLIATALALSALNLTSE